MTEPDPKTVGSMQKMIHQRIEPAQGGLREPPPGIVATDAMQAQIGLQLKAVYETMIAQPIPDRFVELLERLERERAGAKSAVGGQRGTGDTAGKPAEGSTPAQDAIT